MNLQLGARAQAIIVLALVGTLGALAGILGDRLLARRAEPEPAAYVNVDPPGNPDRGGPPGRGGMPGGNQLRFAELLAGLELSAAQRTAIDSIVRAGNERVRNVRQQFEPQLRDIARETRVSIDQVLTEAQRQQLRATRLERLRNLRPNPRRGG